MGRYIDMKVFKKAYNLAMQIFEISKKFPEEEIYSLTDQVRRSSRSVCTNFGEAYRRRRYPAHFLSKLADSDAENTETSIWLKFALDCGYLTEVDSQRLSDECEAIGRILGCMIQQPDKFR